MIKNDIYVVVDTPKKAKKLKKVLNMFEEKLNLVDDAAIKIGHYNGSAKLYTEYNKSYFNGINWTLMDICEDKTKVSIKELRNILAKEHLKVGDYVVLSNGLIGKIIKRIANSKILVLDDENDKVTCLIADFKRYAKPEEIALLEPKQKELEVGKWYKGIVDFDSLIYITEIENADSFNKIYGFGFKRGKWWSGLCYLFSNTEHEKSLIEATPEEVKSALVKEAKKRYKNGDKVKSLYKDIYVGNLDFKNVLYFHDNNDLYDNNDLWISSEYFNIQVFKNGKWAEIIKPEESQM